MFSLIAVWLLQLWSHYRHGARKGGYRDSEQSFVRDGNLVIKTEYKEDGKFGPGYYCDRIDTRNKNNEIPAEFIVDYVRVYQYK